MQIWRSVTQWMARVLAPATAFLYASAVSPEYPVDNSMSTMARFPWIWTCINAIASDQAGLQLVAYRQQRRGKRIDVDDPVLDLLDNPNAAMTGHLFRKQLWLDFELTGNAYIWRPDGPASIAIYRMHPRSIRPIPGPMGIALGYEWTDALTGEVRTLPPEQVFHIRNVSWQDSTASILGESVIRSLHDDLTTEIGQKKTAAINGSRGRPDILFSSPANAPIGDKGADRLVDRWEDSISKRMGAFFAGGGVTATPLSWSASESGEIERSAAIRDTVLAVFGVPRIRVGLSDENYATARQAEKTYWQGLQGRARAFDDVFSRLAAPGVRISHDYSKVESLQVSYTERQNRIMQWVALGWSPETAAAIEGFEGLPPRDGEVVQSKPETAPTAAPNEDEPAQPAERSLHERTLEAVRMHLQCAAGIYGDIDEDIDTRLLVRWQSERLFHSLCDAGHEPVTARWWSEEICGTVHEAHAMGLEDAFAATRAQTFAETIATRRAA